MTSMPMPTQPAYSGPEFRLWSRVLIATLMMILLVGGVGGWMATAELNGAVISQGTVAVSQNLKSVQHREGGIIKEINAKEGDALVAGDVILRLEDTQIRAEQSIVAHQITELVARRARLLAERDNLIAMTLPVGFEATTDAAAEIAEGEVRLFEGQRLNRQGQIQQLELGVEQIGEEINGLEVQRQAPCH